MRVGWAGDFCHFVRAFSVDAVVGTKRITSCRVLCMCQRCLYCNLCKLGLRLAPYCNRAVEVWPRLVVLYDVLVKIGVVFRCQVFGNVGGA